MKTEYGCIWYILLPITLYYGGMYGYYRYRTISIHLDSCATQIDKTPFRGLVPSMTTQAVWKYLGEHDDVFEDKEDGYSLLYYNSFGKLELPVTSDAKKIGIMKFYPKGISKIQDYVRNNLSIRRHKRKIHIYCNEDWKYSFILGKNGRVLEFQYWNE